MYIITGAGSGIGRALAHCLAGRGFSVLAVGRQEMTLAETVAFSPKIQTCCADVSTALGREKIVDAAQNFSEIKGLIHNAGVLEPIALLSSLDEHAWRQTFEINLNAPLFLTQDLMTLKPLGRVLNIGSGAAYFPIKGWGAYCVSKAALAMLTRCWQEETICSPAFACVMPGIADTHMQALARHGDCMAPEQAEFYKQLHRENRLVSPETVALFLTWLLLDISEERYAAQEWDIYDSTHHPEWLTSPHKVPSIE